MYAIQVDVLSSLAFSKNTNPISVQCLYYVMDVVSRTWSMTFQCGSTKSGHWDTSTSRHYGVKPKQTNIQKFTNLYDTMMTYRGFWSHHDGLSLVYFQSLSSFSSEVIQGHHWIWPPGGVDQGTRPPRGTLPHPRGIACWERGSGLSGVHTSLAGKYKSIYLSTFHHNAFKFNTCKMIKFVKNRLYCLSKFTQS